MKVKYFSCKEIIYGTTLIHKIKLDEVGKWYIFIWHLIVCMLKSCEITTEIDFVNVFWMNWIKFLFKKVNAKYFKNWKICCKSFYNNFTRLLEQNSNEICRLACNPNIHTPSIFTCYMYKWSFTNTHSMHFYSGSIAVVITDLGSGEVLFFLMY